MIQEAAYPESSSDMAAIKDGIYFSGIKTPYLSGGHVNPFNGESSGRIVANKAELRARSKSGGQVGRVRAIHNRISELERSAITMYTQVQSYFFSLDPSFHYHCLNIIYFYLLVRFRSTPAQPWHLNVK
jgi:hypothetical protein